MKIIKFLSFKCILDFGTYSNGRTAIELISADGEGPVAVATVNLPGEIMARDEVAIKNYSENMGMLDTLIKAGIIAKPHRESRSGFALIPICKLLINPQTYGKEERILDKKGRN